MWYNEKEDTYIEDFLEEIKEVKFEPVLIPWINDPQINESTSIET